jgi:TPR repeat protein
VKPIIELSIFIVLVVVLATAGSPLAQAQHPDGWATKSNATADNEVNLEQLRAMAAQGDPNAQYRLGQLYEDSEVVEQDLAKAVNAYRDAAEQGHAGAQYALAHIYHLGNGVEQDMAAAMVWYRKAARQGNESAQLALGDQYRIGLVVPRDLAQSTKWYRLAADQGNAFAQYELGNAYRYGNGVGLDLEQATKWYRLSAEAGNPSAQLALVELETVDRMVAQSTAHEAVPPIEPSPQPPQATGWDLAEAGSDGHPDSFETAMASIVEEKAAAELTEPDASPPTASPPTAAPTPSPAAYPASGDGFATPDVDLAFAASPSFDDEQTVSQLLAHAHYQVATLALTTPAGDNAYETYQRVLSVQPDNEAALDGIEQIGVKYVELAGLAAAKGDVENSREYAAKASVLAPEHPLVQSMSVPTEADQPAIEETGVADDSRAEVKALQSALEHLAEDRPEDQVEDQPADQGEAEPKVQIALATPATDSLKDVIENVDDIIFQPSAYQGREVAVAGSVIHFFWNYRLIADAGQNSIVIDVDGLSQADRAKLDAAFDEAGPFDPVRAHIRGTVERQGFANYELAATQLALAVADLGRTEGEDSAPQADLDGLGAVAVSVDTGSSFGQRSLNNRLSRPDSDGGAGAGRSNSSGGGSNGAADGDNGGSGGDNGDSGGGTSGGGNSGGGNSGGGSSGGGSADGGSSGGGSSGSGSSGSGSSGSAASDGGSSAGSSVGGRDTNGRGLGGGLGRGLSDRGFGGRSGGSRGNRGQGNRGRDS